MCSIVFFCYYSSVFLCRVQKICVSYNPIRFVFSSLDRWKWRVKNQRFQLMSFVTFWEFYYAEGCSNNVQFCKKTSLSEAKFCLPSLSQVLRKFQPKKITKFCSALISRHNFRTNSFERHPKILPTNSEKIIFLLNGNFHWTNIEPVYITEKKKLFFRKIDR